MSWFLELAKDASRWSLLAFAVIVANVIFVWLLFRAVARPQPPLTADWVGEHGRSLTKISTLEGKVRVRGRVVIAIADEPIEANRAIKVVQVEGLVAKVKEES